MSLANEASYLSGMEATITPDVMFRRYHAPALGGDCFEATLEPEPSRQRGSSFVDGSRSVGWIDYLKLDNRSPVSFPYVPVKVAQAQVNALWA